MKKGIILLSLICLILVGCGKKIDYEKIMKPIADSYYKKYMINVKPVNDYVISISDLKNANINGNEKYDLSKLKNCKDTSSIKLVTDPATGEITKYEYNLDCKK